MWPRRYDRSSKLAVKGLLEGKADRPQERTMHVTLTEAIDLIGRRSFTMTDVGKKNPLTIFNRIISDRQMRYTWTHAFSFIE